MLPKLWRRKPVDNMTQLASNHQETSNPIELIDMAEPGEFNSSSPNLLRHTCFLSESLPVNGSVSRMYAPTYSSDGVPIEQFIVCHSDSKPAVTGHERENMFSWRPGKMENIKAFEKLELPAPKETGISNFPLGQLQHKDFARSAIESPNFIACKSRLPELRPSTTPMLSPEAPRFEMEVYQGKPKQSAYIRHEASMACPGTTHMNNSTDYAAYHTFPISARVPILTTSIQDFDFTFVDLVSPEPSLVEALPLTPTSGRSRRFSFEFGAPDDSLTIEESYQASLQHGRLFEDTNCAGSFLGLDSDAKGDEIEIDCSILPPSPLLTTKSTPEPTPLPSPMPTSLPKTRYYPGALAALGGYLSLRRKGPRGTLKISHYSNV
ncbi:hypothetical protein H2198_009154 [Neophaeococcomyces mojaviensis]|uniref:Uncharacterized protein n=1 Tax=Neophaeococcomyces mojaviensis TaxID=3383035 RepID=A0ACC2ZVJ2_9EURO|nr:hypothetical protein H2198_009154 [Knufia sp. JES_112]